MLVPTRFSSYDWRPLHVVNVYGGVSPSHDEFSKPSKHMVDTNALGSPGRRIVHFISLKVSIF